MAAKPRPLPGIGALSVLGAACCFAWMLGNWLATSECVRRWNAARDEAAALGDHEAAVGADVVALDLRSAAAAEPRGPNGRPGDDEPLVVALDRVASLEGSTAVRERLAEARAICDHRDAYGFAMPLVMLAIAGIAILLRYAALRTTTR